MKIVVISKNLNPPSPEGLTQATTEYHVVDVRADQRYQHQQDPKTYLHGIPSKSNQIIRVRLRTTVKRSQHCARQLILSKHLYHLYTNQIDRHV